MPSDPLRRPPVELNENDRSGRNRSTRPLDARIADLLDATDRVVAVEDLVDQGLTRRRLYRRVKAGSTQRLHRRVYTVGGTVLSFRGRCRAALVAIGDDACLAAGTACALWGFREPSAGERLQLVCPRQVRDPEGATVSFRPALVVEDTSLRHGLRVVMPALALLGFAATEPDQRRLRRVVNEALVQKRVSVPQLVALLARSRGARGAARLGRALAAAKPTRSELEDATVAALLAFEARDFLTNERLAGYEVDVLFPDAGVVIECDSRYHDTPLARADDAVKEAVLVEAGLVVERVRWRQITTDVHRTIPRILAVVADRVERNRP